MKNIEGSERGSNAPKALLAVSLAALVLSGIAIAAVALVPSTRAPAKQAFTIIMGEGEIIGVNATTGAEEITGEYHRWEPGVLVVHLGDEVTLTVKNPRKNVHSFALNAFGVDTGPLAARTGETTVTFVANKAGVFQFVCGTPHDHDAGLCDEDHPTMVGYLAVLT